MEMNKTELLVMWNSIPWKYIVIYFLTILIVIGSFAKLHLKIWNGTFHVFITLLMASIVLSLYTENYEIALLISILSIVSISNFAYTKHPKQQKFTLFNIDVTKTNDVQNIKKKINMRKRDLLTQSNVFNKLNNDLYYNELGDQYNIQGNNEKINGFNINK